MDHLKLLELLNQSEQRCLALQRQYEEIDHENARLRGLASKAAVELESMNETFGVRWYSGFIAELRGETI